MKKISIRIFSAAICAVILVTSLALCASCNKTADANDKNYKIVLTDGESEYVIIRPEKIPTDLLDNILELRRQIIDKCDYEMKMTTDLVRSQDDIDLNAKEILVGVWLLGQPRYRLIIMTYIFVKNVLTI